VRLRILLCAACVLITAAAARNPSFDPGEVVREIQSHQSAPAGLEPAASSLDAGEFMVDTSIVYIPTAGLQTEPAVAFDGTNWFVVWEDHRDDADIYAARVTSAGIVLDRTGIAISRATAGQYSPAIAFDGTNYLVVWHDTRNGSADDIYGARVTPAGVVLDAAGIPISLDAGGQFSPSVAYDGTNYFVVWTDGRYGGGQTDVFGARVTTAGAVLDTAGIAVRTGAYLQQSPVLAFDGSNYLVAWQHLIVTGYADIHASRVSTSGVVLDSIVVCAADSEQAAPAVAFDGTNYFVVWQDERNGPSDDIYGARVSTAGSVLDPGGIVVSSAGTWQEAPALAFDGTNYLVSWQDLRTMSNDIYAARVNPGGTVLDSTGFVVSEATNTQSLPALAFDGINYLAVWNDARSGTSGDIYGARIGPGGAVLDPYGIAVTAKINSQSNPAVAFDGTNYLLAWSDDRNGDRDIYGARVSQTGALLDTAALAVSIASGDQDYPTIAFDGTNYLVAWEDERGSYSDVYCSRVTTDGSVLDPSGKPVSTAANLQKAPVAAFDGTNYLLVWQDFRDATNFKIYGARVTQAGVVLDATGIPISIQNCYQYAPGIAFDGTNYLVAWMDHRIDVYYDIYAARVSPAGTVLDTAGFVISDAANTQRYPAIASNGTNCLAVWDDARNSADIYGARVTPAGAVLDSAGLAVYEAPGQQLTPKLAFDGTDWLVVWQDGRSGSFTYHVYGARVNTSGVTVDSFIVSTQSDDEHAPAIACGSSGNALAAYYGWTDTLFGSVYDAFRVWARPAPFTTIGIAEGTAPGGHRTSATATIVRGVLVLGGTDSRQNTEARAELLNTDGRKVVDLVPGANDVGRLPAGVYFVRERLTVGGTPGGVHKVVVTR
jgi:hypothetical protein